MVRHTPLLHPIVPHKYNIVGIIKNCDINHLGIFEILFDKTYVENGQDIIKRYIDFEQKNTKYDLSQRLYAVEADSEDYADFQSQVVDENDVVIEIDCKKTTQKDMEMFFNLSEYLDQTNGEPGMYDNGIFKVKINRLIPKEKDLIILKKDN
jgi:hypothetical protein